ncbi:hypothetical protein GGR02_000675 [Anoxybacillus voinovskiensis]|uniref:Uncharacterized protein n=1 Tax=Anoxybacteroides voinovskiense TaxID=230470 RepID=A0A840DMN7_9BACL|nr:hypothetical protein [Anoxybacillus voinovskiensis]MBB4072915.1 hypothetical protein [Anoxybacillus voinovskiensis]GGJ81570.1 hypothetical protein GCM10008982_33790 [Anoxybacillus voinovskiensis]
MTYAPENIETRLNNCPIEIPEELAFLKKELEKGEERKKQKGESYIWNRALFSLEKYSVLRTHINEDMKVVFSLIPSDYYTFKSLNPNLDTPLPSGYTIREKYLNGTIAKKPIIPLM